MSFLEDDRMKSLLLLLLLVTSAQAGLVKNPQECQVAAARHDITLAKKVNPLWWLANEDRDYDPDFMPDKPHKVRKFWFAVRNPGHNFTHYVIGVAHKDTVRKGTSPCHVWNDRGGKVNLAHIKSGAGLKLPFISYRGKHIESYIGWRERGNFGIALRRRSK